jgi:hypothetical protein
MAVSPGRNLFGRFGIFGAFGMFDCFDSNTNPRFANSTAGHFEDMTEVIR